MNSPIDDNTIYYIFAYWGPDKRGLNLLISEVGENGIFRYLALSSEITSKNGTVLMYGYYVPSNRQDCDEIRRYFRGIGVGIDQLKPVSGLFSQCDIFTSTKRTYTQYGIPPIDGDIPCTELDTKVSIIKSLMNENQRKTIESLTDRNINDYL